MELSEGFVDLVGEVVAGFVAEGFADGLPFVDCDDDRAALFEDGGDEGEVVDHEGGEGVHDVDDNVALLDVGHGASLDFAEVLFVGFGDVGGGEACCVDELDFSSFEFHAGPDAVACGVRFVGNDYPFLSEQFVDKGRFAHVRSSDHAYFDHAFQTQVSSLCSSFPRKHFFRSNECVFVVLSV